MEELKENFDYLHFSRQTNFTAVMLKKSHIFNLVYLLFYLFLITTLKSSDRGGGEYSSIMTNIFLFVLSCSALLMIIISVFLSVFTKNLEWAIWVYVYCFGLVLPYFIISTTLLGNLGVSDEAVFFKNCRWIIFIFLVLFSFFSIAKLQKIRKAKNNKN